MKKSIKYNGEPSATRVQLYTYPAEIFTERHELQPWIPKKTLVKSNPQSPPKKEKKKNPRNEDLREIGVVQWPQNRKIRGRLPRISWIRLKHTLKNPCYPITDSEFLGSKWDPWQAAMVAYHGFYVF
ncbi:hypothetical protein PIB30_012977 [Stylosanthes scabra]|uniref:Uncharacterized protein n=1 Tax=Stylosanthes scabra TaxID=79078 RepID=A0ABU6Q675_9FABA|nr:hypothetical protein [Stylosanthes scabra]